MDDWSDIITFIFAAFLVLMVLAAIIPVLNSLVN